MEGGPEVLLGDGAGTCRLANCALSRSHLELVIKSENKAFFIDLTR